MILFQYVQWKHVQFYFFYLKEKETTKKGDKKKEKEAAVQDTAVVQNIYPGTSMPMEEMSAPYMAINGNLYNLHDFAALDTIIGYSLASSCTNCTLHVSSAVRALDMGKAPGTAASLPRSSSALAEDVQKVGEVETLQAG